jgi:purine-binding chemotaxis protein CheW
MGTLAKSKTRDAGKCAGSGVEESAATGTSNAEVSGSSSSAVGIAPRSVMPSSSAMRAGRGADVAEHETQVVTFLLGREEYAIEILQVQEIVMMTEITRMPKAPHFIEGIVNLRGQMIPIIDMRKRLELAEAVNNQDTRIIILNVSDETVGMIVDGVREVLRIPDTAISPPPKMIRGISAEYLRGIGRLGERLLIMLDLDKIFSAEETSALRQMDSDGCPYTKE